jgi:ketosteroid isomerase-like protein
MGGGSRESSKSVVARYFDMWNTGDTSMAADILSPEWVDHAHPEVTGPEGVRRAVDSIRAARPDLRFRIDAIVGDDDLVAAIGGVGQAPQPGSSPGQLIWLVSLKDGRMTEMRTYHETHG